MNDDLREKITAAARAVGDRCTIIGSSGEPAALRDHLGRETVLGTIVDLRYDAEACEVTFTIDPESISDATARMLLEDGES